MEEEHWQTLVQGFRDGNPEVIATFWREYGPALQRIADRHLAERMRRRIDPEDVVQSACRTFFRRVQGGQLQLVDSESLWRLLCAITLTKVRKQVRFHSRKKRGLAQEEQSTADFDLVSSEPAPDEVVAFTDQFEHLLGLLDEEERQIVDLKLQDHTHEEVAVRMGSSERTVRRIFKRIQEKLLRAL